MTTETKVKWAKLDPAKLDEASSKLHKAMSDANKAAKTNREAFEAHMLKGRKAPQGFTFKFSYKYGLAVALVPFEAPKGNGKAQSLADWLESNAA